MKNILFIYFSAIFLFSCNTKEEIKQPHIVFVTGDEEYRSEESMPMLADILKRELNANISICYSLDSLGFVDPNRTDHIAGLEALEEADLMVMFTRFRNLPDHERKYITAYAESGKPMVGFRTSTHSFMYKEDSTKFHMNNEWPAKVFGQQWITHHGHFADGHGALTSVELIESEKSNQILKGVNAFEAYSWLYHVDGGKWKLHGNSKPILRGKSLKSNHEMNNRLEEFPLTNPVAWTKTYTGESDTLTSRVFFTTLGHPYDFKHKSMRKLALNGIYWALSEERLIPELGVNAEIEGIYEPNNSGFGMKFKKELQPKYLKQTD
jgi:type 1 glutamine amidotransferase